MIVIGSDHGGFELKEYIKEFLKSIEVEYYDVGTYDNKSVDYPDYALKVAQDVVLGRADKGIICCGTGIGVSIAANKVPGIRAALCTDEFCAEMSRKHNDSNVLCLGGRILDKKNALNIVNKFLDTEFEKGRHEKRIEKIKKIEDKYRRN